MEIYQEMVQLFEQANSIFLKEDLDLLISRVSERTLCGALMVHLHDIIVKDPRFDGYYADIEYNRNKRGRLKTIKRRITEDNFQVLNITCDLILHSRGQNLKQDNLIAVEMKKSTRPMHEKYQDRERLIALTKDTFDDVWSFDGKTLPEHVCRYILGIYYEINYSCRQIMIEYYRKGKQVFHYYIPY